MITVLKAILIIILFFSMVSIPTIVNAQKVKYEFASIENLAEQEIARIVLPKIYQTINKKISIIPLPANRAQYEANTGIKAGEALRIYTYGLENKEVIRVPTPYYHLFTSVFSLAKNKINISNKSDLKKYKIGKVIGVKHTNNITQGLTNVYNSKNTVHLFQQLLLGNIDVALTNQVDGELTIKQNNLLGIKLINRSLAKLDLFHYIHKNHKNLVKPINETIKKLKANGELAKMFAQAEEIILK